MNPVISIVVPTYRRPALLAKCIEALVAQKFPENLFEIIIVTDGPDPASVAVVESFDTGHVPVLRIHSLPEKKGPAAARNAGWQLARGRLICFTDDDCLPHKNWINSFWFIWRQQPSDTIVFTGQVLVPRPAKPTDYEKNISWLEKADFVTANCACTKTALEMTGGFDEEFPVAWREDSELEFRFLKLNIPIQFVQQAVITHPVRKAGWGVSIKEQKKSMFNALLYKKHPDLYRRKIHRRPIWNYYAMTLLVILGLVAAVAGWKYIMVSAFTGWLILLTLFIVKRLKGTSHSFTHVVEMIITSVVIPMLSVYWTLYGSFKYKSRLL